MATPISTAPVSTPTHSVNSTQPQNITESRAVTASKIALYVSPLIAFFATNNFVHSYLAGLGFWQNAGYGLVSVFSGAAASIAISIGTANLLDRMGISTK